MTVLILGVVLWAVVHFFKRLAPASRGAMTARMGEASKGVIALLLVLSVVLMVLGYRAADFTSIWNPAAGMTHANNLLMLVALYIYGAGGPKGSKVWLGTKLRHPQLAGFALWAVAHLLPNGDLASIVLFGGLLVWSLAQMALINRAEGPWTPPARRPFKSEVILVVITLVLYALIAAVHMWLGKVPFGG